ncbi:hypothetical protein RhiJN_02292 [Ceratobasidium sp. AG-Ba]|nr:hypothetical protein RhiJN_02292 [Ceratobasidium sp. AG-Ba]
MAPNDHVSTAFTHLLVSIMLPTLFFALALAFSDKSSPEVMLSLLVLSSTLPLAIHTSVYSRLAMAQTSNQTQTQPQSYDLFWVLPAALYASISTLQRYFMVALYAISMGSGYAPSGRILGIVYMLGVMEWTTVSQLSVLLWRTSREIEAQELQKSEPVHFVNIPRIVVTVLED